jgi:prophage regulatory protein
MPCAACKDPARCDRAGLCQEFAFASMPRLFTREQLPEFAGLSTTTIEEEIRQGRFPKPRQLSAKRVAWLDSDLRKWAESLPVSDLPPPPNTGAKKPKDTRGVALPDGSQPNAG